MIVNSKREAIAWEVIKTLVKRFKKFPKDSSENRNAPFHEAFLNAFVDELEGKVVDIPFLISISSWLHGLSTTLGQSFFENVAHVLSDGEKRDFTPDSNMLLQITNLQKSTIADIITDLKNRNKQPDLEAENIILVSASTQGDVIDANKFSVDVYIDDDDITAIELKTVKPNSGEMRGEKQKILEAKAALFKKYSGKRVSYYIGFPFDPTSDTPTDSDKARFMNSIIGGTSYFAPKEVLLAGELWDFLSGDTNTMKQILEIINTIATPEFMNDYKFLKISKNRKMDQQRYRILLKKWFLFSELFLFDNDKKLKENINTTSDKRQYNQHIFKYDGKYKLERFYKLSRLLQ
ncbi:MAG: TdeIII family type II restriction endonuclease [Chloroflexota bacterium]|nr:TdeIII family type II restriction endonuclease [Chloroflexota bacterium]